MQARPSLPAQPPRLGPCPCPSAHPVLLRTTQSLGGEGALTKLTNPSLPLLRMAAPFSQDQHLIYK